MDPSTLNPAQTEWVNNLYKYLGLAALTGGGLRAAKGLTDIVGDNLQRSPAPPKPILVDVPYHRRKPPEAEGVVATPKAASDAATPGGLAWWLGANAEGHKQIPLAPVAYMAALGLGGAGGWLGADKLLAARRKKQLEGEVADSQNELYQAQLGKFKPLDLEKISADMQAVLDGTPAADPAWQKVADAVDKLAAVYVKKADGAMDALAMLPTWAAQGYSSIALPAAVGAGFIAHRYARVVDPAKAKAQAIKQQLEEANRTRTPSMYARLVPVDPEKEENKIAAQIESRAKAFLDKLFGQLNKAADEPGPLEPAKTPEPPAPKALKPSAGPAPMPGMMPQLPGVQQVPGGMPGAAPMLGRPTRPAPPQLAQPLVPLR